MWFNGEFQFLSNNVLIVTWWRQNLVTTERVVFVVFYLCFSITSLMSVITGLNVFNATVATKPVQSADEYAIFPSQSEALHSTVITSALFNHMNWIKICYLLNLFRMRLHSSSLLNGFIV